MRGFAYAIKGLKTAFSTEVNLKTHLTLAILALFSGWYFEISTIEWTLIILCIGIVLSAELLNTAIEYLVNLVSPEIHPVAGKIKDIAAGAVLVASLAALATGLIIFIPKIMNWLP